jgi:8-oxo-dGTP pyrophosphatase MutT (NUDIX family)
LVTARTFRSRTALRNKGAVEDPFLCVDEETGWPNVRPKHAACLILVRRKGRAVRVLMGERHSRHVFLPGRFVFPGGRLDPGDLRLAMPTDLRPEVRAKVAAGSGAARARGLALAAIRETFEETGLLVGERSATTPRSRSEPWRRFFSHGVVPRLEALDFIARAITPPGRPRRYDARFFLADAGHIAHTLDAGAVSGELLNPAWLTLAEAREADVLPITRCVLREVEARLAGERDRPVPFYIPRRGRAVIVPL